MRYIIALIILLPVHLLSRDCLDDAWKYYNKQEYNKAINSINSCLDQIIADADPEEMDYAFRGLTSNFTKLGIIDSALKNTLIALSIEEKHNLNSAISLNELGTIYSRMGLNHQAIYYLKKAYNINTANDNSKSSIKNLNNISIAFLNLGMLDSAESYLEKSLSNANEDTASKHNILNNLSLLYFTKSNLDKAIKYSFQAINNFPKNINIHDSLLIISNYELILMLNDESNTMNSLKLYKSLESSNDNSIYSADVNYKLSLFEAKLGNTEQSIVYLNHAVKIYVSMGDIIRAKQITNTFVKYANDRVISKLNYSQSKLTEMQLIAYSKQLENDINTKIISDKYISEMENEMQYTRLSLYLSISIIISMLLTIGFVFYKIRSSNHIKRLVYAYNNYLDIIYQLDSKRLKTNLTKINNYMVLDKSFHEKKYFTDLVSEVVDDTNKIRSTVKSGIDFQQKKRLNNGKHTTTNELPMDR